MVSRRETLAAQAYLIIFVQSGIDLKDIVDLLLYVKLNDHIEGVAMRK